MYTGNPGLPSTGSGTVATMDGPREGLTMRQELHAACLMDGIELFEPIGQGGSATVWRARWQEREVAVKVLNGAGGLSPQRPLPHPSILHVLGQGNALGQPYLIFERFPTDLGRLLDGRPLRQDLLRRVLVPLLDAIEFAHRRGVLHGDIKPANVLVDPAAAPPRVALADFGHGGPIPEDLDASMLSRSNPESLATLPYMAPERLSGTPASPASDVYALGVLLFEVLTGRLPIGLELPSELVPGVGRRLDSLVKRAMARVAQARPSVAEIRKDLLRLLPALGSDSPSADMVYVPGGVASIGSLEVPDAGPPFETSLDPFWIDLTPVTQEAYFAFLRATGRARPSSWARGRRLPAAQRALPVTGVSWEDARAFAEWSGKRLPTELEWERVARGRRGWPYPYGQQLDLSRIHVNAQSLAPVGSYPAGASEEGVLDLTGNGWEWTASAFGPYGEGPRGSSKVIRGGYDPSLPESGSASARVALRPDARDPGVTFRCAADANA